MANNDYIITDCKLTVSKNTAKLDEEIFLYKNDRNIKLLIEIVDNKYRYKSDDLSNLLVKYKASYAQVKWYKNAEVKKEFPIQATDDGKVVFVIEGQLIDEDTELGDYDLQLRLLNESQESIRSLPIIKGAVHILKPLFEEGDIATVNSAVADVSMLSLDGDAIDTYNSDGTYNQTNWGNGDVISSAKLNKLEKVAKDNVDKVNKMPAKSIVEGGKIYLAKEDGTKLDSGTELPAGGTGTSYDDTEIKTDINTIKTDLGTAQLTTTAKDIKGAVNEVAAQYKDIANEIKNLNYNYDLSFTEVPTQPSYNDEYLSWTSEDFFAKFYDGFVENSNDNYKVIKTLLGKDTSNTYNIYKYVFEPKNYEQTIILTSGMHGYEETAPIAVARLMHHVVNDNQNMDIYKYLKNKVRIVVIPLVNPWGFNQNPRKYGTVTGVNPSRNYDYNWDSYVSSGSEWDLKGSSAFSEKETQYMRDTYLLYKDDISFTLDCHTGRGWTKDVFVYYVESDNILKPKLIEAATWLDNRIKNKYNKTTNNEIMQTDRALNLLWLNKIQNIPSGTVEFSPTLYSSKENDSVNVTEYLTNLTNYIASGLQIKNSNNTNTIDTSKFATKEDLNNVNTEINTINSNIPFSFVQITKDAYNSLAKKVINRVYLVEGYGLYLGTTCIISTDNQQGGGEIVTPDKTGLLASVNLANGNVTDKSGNNNNAVLSGTYTTDSEGIIFDGKDGVIDTGLKLLQDDNEFSVIYTFMPSNISDTVSQYVISQGNGSEVGSLLHQFSENRNSIKIINKESPLSFYFIFGNSTDKINNDNIILATNTKYMCCITYKNNALNYYVNGVLRATYNGQIQLANANLLLGNRNDKIRGFKGKIYSYKIYNSCLTSEYINKIYNEE